MTNALALGAVIAGGFYFSLLCAAVYRGTTIARASIWHEFAFARNP